MDAGRFESFISYLAVSTWILNGSSIECHEKKHQPFSLSGVRFGSRAIHLRESLLDFDILYDENIKMLKPFERCFKSLNEHFLSGKRLQ